VLKFHILTLILTLAGLETVKGQNYYVIDEEFSTASTLNRGEIFDFFVEGDGDIVIMSNMINANTGVQSFCRIDNQGNLVDNLADGNQPGIEPYLEGMLIFGTSSIAHVDAQNTLYDYYEYIYTTPDFYHPFSQIHDAQVLPDRTFLAGGWINVDSVTPGAPGSFRCMLKLDSTGTAVPSFPEFTCQAFSEFPFQSTHILSLDTNSIGDIIASGSFVAINGVETNHIARISQDGVVDSSFSTPITGQGGAIMLLVDSQDRIWFTPVYEASIDGIDETPKLIRLLPNGELDESYNHPYLFEDQIMLPPMESYPSGVAELPDGTFIITGFMYEADGYACKTIVHIDDSGNILDDFWLQTGPSEAVWGEYVKDHYTSDVHITDDGKIYIAGQFSEFNGFETSSIVRLRPSGLNTENEELDGNLEIFPNPAEDYITIVHSGSQLGEFKIIDAKGDILIENILVAGESKVDVTRLDKGIYFVQIEVPDLGRSTKKFVKF